jgi:hypothetical protein
MRLRKELVMQRIGLSFVIAAVLALAAFLPEAGADEGPGVTFGGNLTIGHAGCDAAGEACGEDLNAANGFDLHLGVQPIRRLALLADGWYLRTGDDDGQTTQSMISFGPRLWLGGLYAGVGLGFARASFDDAPLMDVEQDGAAWQANAGLEILSLGAVAVGLELRAVRSLDQDDLNLESYTLGVGAQWR